MSRNALGEADRIGCRFKKQIQRIKENILYIKVVQFTSTTKMQKQMLEAFLTNVWFPQVIKLGALSCRYVSIDETKAMMINMFPSEEVGESVQVGREEERNELRQHHKYIVFKRESTAYVEA